MAELQLEAPHWVPFAAVHAPLPLQLSAMHPAMFCVQKLCGSCPAKTSVHVPTLPETLQARHPLQVVAASLQQKESTQLPEAHWFPVAQPEPFPYFPTQAVPPWQKFPAAHSTSVPTVQVV